MPRISSTEADQAYQSLLRDIGVQAIPTAGMTRIEVAFPPVEPLAWLSSQHVSCGRYYWRDRAGYFEMAGISESDIVAAEDAHTPPGMLIKRLRTQLAGYDSDFRYYGGFRFHSRSIARGRWRDFKAYRFVLPLLELRRSNGQYTLACNLTANQDRQQVLRLLHEVSFAPCSGTIPALPHFGDREDAPRFEEWTALVADALAAIEGQAFQKVVLARQSTFHGDGPIAPFALLQRLAVADPKAFHFCFAPTASRAFLGASPEQLYKRSGKAIFTEALAGTRPRGETPEADAALEQELLHSAKENAEHKYVVDAVYAALPRFCYIIQAPYSPTVMKLARCQHLHTPITGTLSAGADDSMLLETLHPTPAVGGTPKEAALRWILENEPFERGIYAAPAGWVGTTDAEFCVAIRSGLVRDNTLSLYSGAGIVTGADAADEWRELDAKLANFLDVIMKDH